MTDRPTGGEAYDRANGTAAQKPSGIRLFGLFGINVYLHWTWIIVAVIIIRLRSDAYESIYWTIAEYLTLFLIVLLHEFGHALACRSVGGAAPRIVLWPLGGLAYVSPPQRPWPVLWSIAAGPLVNVVLVPVTIAAYVLADRVWPGTDLATFALSLAAINLIILIFNMLPIYPLDGGQILRALLWFVLGRVRSLLVAAVIGLAGAAGLLVLGIAVQSIFTIAIAAFIGLQAYAAFSQSRTLGQMLTGPRHAGFACPACGAAPPIGAHWSCESCGHKLDAFIDRYACPRCAAPNGVTPCIDCGAAAPAYAWDLPQQYAPPPLPQGYVYPHPWPPR